MTQKEKMTLLEETIEAEEGSLTADMLLESVDEYDSMSKLSIVVMMEDEFEKRLTSSEIKAFKTVGDILKIMEK